MHKNTREPQPTRWQARPLDDVVWVEWGHDHVAYHRPSGATHFLNASSKILITEILSCPKEADEVTKAFGTETDSPDWSARSEEMRAMLEQLEHLGFIERL